MSSRTSLHRDRFTAAISDAFLVPQSNRDPARSNATRWRPSTSIARAPREVVLTLRDGNELKVDRAVLALGNPSPARLVVDGLAPDDPRYYNSPFETGATDGLEADSPVLLVGSGLTAVDGVVALRARGHRGVVYMLSRHGQMPHPHTVYRKTCPAPPVQPGLPLGAALRAVRVAAGRAADWRTVVDAYASGVE